MSAAPKDPGGREPHTNPHLRALPHPSKQARPDAYASAEEKALLAALCLNNGWIEQVGPLRQHPEWISLPHQDIAVCVFSMINQGQPADLITVANELEERGADITVADLNAILTPGDEMLTPLSVKAYADTIRRCANERLAFKYAERATLAFLERDQDKIDELAVEFRDAMKQFIAADEQVAPRFAFMSDTEVENMAPPEWLVGDILVENTLSIIYGEYGSAKSFLALDFALCIATGTPWLGHAVKQGCVAYIAGEGIGGMGKRIKAWKSYRGWSGPSGLHLLGDPPQLLEAGDIRLLIAALHALPETPSLVIIDTLARSLVGGDENSAQDMGLAIQNAEAIRREFDCHVAIIHHTPWDAKRPRGSSSLPGAAYTTIAVAKDENAVTVHCGKQKDYAVFPDISLMLHSVALDDYADETSCVLIEGAGQPSATPRSQQHRTPHSEQLISEYLMEVSSATFAEIRDVVQRQSKLTDRAIRFALDRMLTAGVLVNERGSYSLVPSEQ